MYYKIVSIDSHETWVHSVGGGARVGARPPPVKNHENEKKFILKHE